MSVSYKYLAASAACAMALSAQSAAAQAEVVVHIDAGSGPVSLSMITQGSEDAASFVRGCTGFAPAEGDGAHIEVSSGVEQLFFSGGGPETTGLLVQTPSGTFSCAMTGMDGSIEQGFLRPQPGRYIVMPVGQTMGNEIETFIWVEADPGFADQMPTDPFDMADPFVHEGGAIDLATLGPPRQGAMRLDPLEAETRQLLARGSFVAVTEADVVVPGGGFCAGFIGEDAPDVVLTLDNPLAALSLFTLSDGDPVLVVRDPSGTWSCNDDSFGLNSNVTIANAQAGEYHVWVGSWMPNGMGGYELFASMGGPMWSDATLDADAEPRVGRYMVDPLEAETRQLVARGSIVATDDTDAMTPMYCAGFIGADAPDVVLTLEQTQPVLSLYAMSQTDLTILVVDPAGDIACNDDTFMFNPAVVLENAQAGEYRIWVGAYSQGATGEFDLMATLGGPRWTDQELTADAAPVSGTVAIGSQTERGFRLPFTSAPSETPAMTFDGTCRGFITPERPDVVVTITDSLPQVTLYSVSESDGVLLVRRPDGTIVCNDDFQALNPGIVLSDPMPGDYAVWIGTYGGQGGTGTFGVTRDVPLWVVDRDL